MRRLLVLVEVADDVTDEAVYGDLRAMAAFDSVVANVEFVGDQPLVVLHGSPRIGFVVQGPWIDSTHAVQALAEGEADCWVMPMVLPEPKKEEGQ